WQQQWCKLAWPVTSPHRRRGQVARHKTPWCTPHSQCKLRQHGEAAQTPHTNDATHLMKPVNFCSVPQHPYSFIAWEPLYCQCRREIAKFLAAVQAAVYGSAQPLLTAELWDSVLARKLHEHSERKTFRLGHHGTGDSASTAMLEQQLRTSIQPRAT
ncbi:AAA domain-containing protein, partial [Haematococcus lacustris]